MSAQMFRRRWPTWSLAACVVAAAFYAVHAVQLTSAADTSAVLPAATDRYNVVVILTDDQDFRSPAVMPNVNTLIRGAGTTFLNSFVSYSLCCPSRATLLTGQHAHNHGVMHNLAPTGGYAKLDHTNTLAVWLQDAGYVTAHIGKFLNGYGTQVPRETVPPGWTEWYTAPDPDAYSFYNFSLNENGTLVAYGADEASYQTDVYARKAVNFIQRRAADGAPFFLWVSPLAPHDDSESTPGPEPAPRHKGRYATAPLPQSPSFNETDVSDKPAMIQALPVLAQDRIDRLTTGYRRRLESLLAVDELVKSVVDALQAGGVLDRTVIIFTSDNGFLLGEHRVPGGKVHLYEESIRVPLFIRHPAFSARTTRREMVVNIDLAPTIVALTGVTANRVMDGRSLVPLVDGTATGWRTHFLVEAARRKIDGSEIDFEAVRARQFLYAEHKTGETELYNFVADACHAADPYQLESQHANSCYTATITDLAQRLGVLRTCAGETCWQ